MAYESSATKFKLYLETSTGVYSELCPNNLDFDSGETLDSWNNLCSSVMNNVKVSIDPTWSVTFKFDSTSTVAQFLLAKQFAVGSNSQCKVRIVNLLAGTTGKQIDFTATISGISYSAVTEEVLSISFDIKVASGSTFVESNYSSSI